MLKFIRSLALPQLNYNTAIYLDAFSTLRTRLQRLANAVVWFIFRFRSNTHITRCRLQLGWLQNDSRRDYFAMFLMHTIVWSNEFSILLSLFTPYQSNRPTSGSIKDFEFTNLSSGTFQVRYAKLWNSVPQSTRDRPSYWRFKRYIQRHVLKCF